MIKIIFIILNLLYIAYAENINSTQINGQAYGVTEDEAIKNAIDQALENKGFSKLHNFKFSFDGNFDVGYNQDINSSSNGNFNSYEIQELTRANPSQFYAKVLVYKKLDTETNFIKETSIIVINTQKDILSIKFEQEFLNLLLQEKTFKIIDRTDMENYKNEEDVLKKDNKNIELIKFYADLKADFLLILTPKITNTQNEGSMQMYEVDINYELIDCKNQQVKLSDQLNFTMTSTSILSKQKAFKNIAKQIVDDISKNSYSF
ncbi:hypothetical protein FPD38_04175 [Campylobacter volucris]|uniref:Uncharacterized protein n=1 Tax=Campylobacter volucris TaxID=1031542 RepID=A0A5C7E297_9BACT|nr:hypothetical protein [Campylobacter volucris]TXE88041.1 hypothetical protein FPD38_04175 [Campylobacter volucris]